MSMVPVKRFASLVLLLCALAPLCAQRTVTIESARSTEYVRTGEGEEQTERIVFRGDVVIAVRDGTIVSRIGAQEVVYDKTRDMLEARGSVTFDRKTGTNSSQKFSGDSLLFDIKDYEGVFLDGVVTQNSGKKSGDPYIVHSEITGRDSGGTMAFKNAMLTSCDSGEPHWSINASRIWLLPGNEIAILNGLFFIGPLPVLYIPAFYYPSDDMIVNPVFGYRTREGYFVQTTTYLSGRKQLESTNSSKTTFSNFLQSDTLKEQERHGLFLKNLETDLADKSPDYVKLMFDAYSTLGAMAGLEGNLSPKDGYIKNFRFSSLFGISRTVYLLSGNSVYTSYDLSGNEERNDGYFFGMEIPFRYRHEISFSMDKKPFRVSVSMPLISDPFFRKDFSDRSEDLNWFKFVLDQDKLATTNTVSEETSYSWNINASISPDVSFAAPWITSFTVSNLSGLMTFNSKTNTTVSDSFSPERRFFYPEIIRPQIKMSMGGTILSSARPSAPAKAVKADTGNIQDPFASEGGGQDGSQDTAGTERFIPSGGNSLIPSVQPLSSSYTLNWSFEPSFLHETRYNAKNWNEPSDVDWNTYASTYYQLRADGTVRGNFARSDQAFSLSSTLNFTGVYQDHPWLSEEVYSTEASRNAVLLTDYKANVYSVTNTSSSSFSPFRRDSLLKPVSMSWNLNSDIIRTVFTGTVDDPRWEVRTVEWSRQFIKTHTATATVGVSLANYDQTLRLTSNLPPLLESYAGTATFNHAFTTISMTTRLFERENLAKRWFWDPYTARATVYLPLQIRLSQEYVYNIEDNTHSRLHYALSRDPVSATFTMAHTYPYTLQSGSGWIVPPSTDKEFIPTSAGFAFNNSAKPLRLYTWKNRIFLQAQLSTSVNFDLLKLTDSFFVFTPGLTLKIHEFLDLSFSSTSRNDSIARYYQNWIDLSSPLPGETNIFTDLVKSFNFGNEQDRIESAFKLKNLALSLTHYLHDWTANLKITAIPELVDLSNGRKKYEFIPELVFMVQWKPISDIKTTVKSADGVFSLNVSDDDEDDAD